MTQAVNVPGVGTLNFPDGMSQADMASAIQKNFPQIHNQQPVDSNLAATGKRAVGGLEGDTNAVISGISAPIQGLAGLGGAAYGAVKGALDPNDTASNAAANSSQTAMQAVQNYTPQITAGQGSFKEGRDATQQTLGAISGAPAAILNKGYDFLRSGKPATGQEAQTEAKVRSGLDLFGNALPLLLGPKGKIAESPIPETTPLSTARNMGYSVMPSEAAIKGGSAPVGKIVEGLAGSAKTGVSAVMKNQPVTNSLAASDIAKTAPDLGITPKTELTPQILDKARAINNAVYAKVSSLGSIPTDGAYKTDLANVGRTPGNSFPGAADPDIDKLVQTYNVNKFDAGDAVLQIRNLRKNATANYKASAANQVKNAPMLGELADAQQTIADALENQLERHAGSPADKVGNPALIKDWRQARKNLAIINTVDNSIKEGTTDVSAEALAKQLNKGAPLSGNLQKIADMQNNFPISIRDVTRVRNKVPINALEGIMGTSGAGAALLGEPHLGAGLVAGMVARPLARTALLSSPYQNALLPKPGISPFIKSMIDPAVLQALQTGNK